MKYRYFGNKSCHPERSEGSGWPHVEILSAAKDDKPDLSYIRSGEVLSPNVCLEDKNLRGVFFHATDFEGFSGSLFIIWQLEKMFPLRGVFSQYILNAGVNRRANRHTSMDRGPAYRGKYYMWVSHICETVIDMLYAGRLVTVSCAICPPTIQMKDRLCTCFGQHHTPNK